MSHVGMGFLPALAAVASAAGPVAGQILGGKQAKDDARAAEKAAQQALQAQRLQMRADAASSKRWVWIAGIGAVAAIGVALIVVSKKRKKRGAR